MQITNSLDYVEYDGPTVFVVSTQRYNLIHDWMELILKVGTSSQKGQLTTLLFEGVKFEFLPAFSRGRVLLAYCCRQLTISLFWFVIKHKGISLMICLIGCIGGLTKLIFIA